MYFVYIIESQVNKRYYIGQTDNLEVRIERHNKGRNLSTKAYLPWELKWWKEYETRAEAMKIEKKLKGIKKREGIEYFVRENSFRGVAQPGPDKSQIENLQIYRGSTKNIRIGDSLFFGISAS
jgi:putative endonuclease